MKRNTPAKLVPMNSSHGTGRKRQSKMATGSFLNGTHSGAPVLITGGAGFIGSNLADRFLRRGTPVIVYDNLSRPGVELNVEWLRETHGDLVEVAVADVRDHHALAHAIERASAIFHLAAQVAVTSSLEDPTADFEVNARGTLNLLEAVRALRVRPPLIFTSTNKVYGSLDGIALRLANNRYEPTEPNLRARGVSETQPLEFYSPYGCSKGTADQYVLDYARTFGLPAMVFRMSCIYGPHQFGTEDQGWVAHFLIQAMKGRPITLYGDGKQVRDILFVEDLLDAFFLAKENIHELSGRAFNIGGGPENTTSLLELVDAITVLQGGAPRVKWGNWRPGDQRFYVSDHSSFREATGWGPQTRVGAGLARLQEWLLASDSSVRHLAEAS